MLGERGPICPHPLALRAGWLLFRGLCRGVCAVVADAVVVARAHRHCGRGTRVAATAAAAAPSVALVSFALARDPRSTARRHRAHWYTSHPQQQQQQQQPAAPADA